jgi:hypothetical protein
MQKNSYLGLFALFSLATGLPDQGRWMFSGLHKSENYVGVTKNAYKGSHIFVDVKCEANEGDTMVTVGWLLRRTPCWEEYVSVVGDPERVYEQYYQNPDVNIYDFAANMSQDVPHLKDEMVVKCDNVIVLPNRDKKIVAEVDKDLNKVVEEGGKEDLPEPSHKRKKRQADSYNPTQKQPQYTLVSDGVYLIVVYIGKADKTFTASVTVDVKSDTGYLSITDWPLLPFYGVMCGVYVIMGVAWLIVGAMHWRDILRIQFWIGGVIFLGMLEKAMFYAEYQNINYNGVSTQGLIIAAEVVSCAKRTLARMLVIIVSLGFGIVKPRLGPTLQRVVSIGGLYFVLAVIESILRVIHPKNDPSGKTLLAAVPLAVIDSSICWWVFSALVQTTRTLRLRRNTVKLSLYKHFANTLVFSVLASIVFMLWSIKYHKLVDCLTDWRDLWVDEAFWHLLFSTILLVIMVLWRPSQNNQRYAFTPLLDGEEDYSSDEETLYNDAWDGMKMRGGKSSSRPDTPSGADPEEDPLKWVEENIPEGDAPLPIIDSEEEIETTKMEISKMQ